MIALFKLFREFCFLIYEVVQKELPSEQPHKSESYLLVPKTI